MLFKRLETRQGFVPSVVMDSMILLVIVAIIAAVLIPVCTNYIKKTKTKELRQNTLTNYYNLAAFVNGTLDKSTLCPFTEKPYEITIENGKETLIWPDPGNFYLTRPRFVKTESGTFFVQDLNPYQLAQGHSAPLPGGFMITNEKESYVMENRKNHVKIQIPKDGGRLFAAGPKTAEPAEIDNILAATPIGNGENSYDFTVLYIENQKVKTKRLFSTGSGLPDTMYLLHNGLFPDGKSLPRLSLSSRQADQDAF